MSPETPVGRLLTELDVENVYIYVGDAVRWDFLADRIANRGVTIKTVSASTMSAPSFTSLLSGRSPPSHQVYSFRYAVPESVATLLDIDGYHTGFLNSIFEYATKHHEGLDPIYEMLGIDEPLTEPAIAETPFCFMERGPGGHAPYGEFTGGAKDYFEQRPDHTERDLKREYRRSIALDTELFFDRLAQLEEQGLREDTLVIYTSDHGELLGEGGNVGHNSPMRPEAVYVPTVFIHPDLPSRRVTERTMSHVDLLPTVVDLLDIDHGQAFDGQSVLDGLTDAPRCTIYNNEFIAAEFPGTDGRLRFDGVWDSMGGYVFPESSLPKRWLVLAGKLLKSPKRRYLRHHLLALLYAYSQGARSYGGPDFSREAARSQLRDCYDTSRSGDQQTVQETNREQLEDLGYL